MKATTMSMRRALLLIVFVLQFSPAWAQAPTVHQGKVIIRSTATDALCVGGNTDVSPSTCTGAIKAGVATFGGNVIIGIFGSPSLSFDHSGITSGSVKILADDSAGSIFWRLQHGGDNSNLVVVNRTSGLVTIPKGDVEVTRSNAGGIVRIKIENTETLNALSRASLLVATSTGGGDSLVQWTSGAGDFAMGIDNTDDILKIAPATLGTGDLWQLTASGNMTVLGTTTVTGFGTHSFNAGGVGNNILEVRNTTAGMGNTAIIRVGPDGSVDRVALTAFSSTFTTSGPNVADGGKLSGSGPGGLSINTSDPTGDIRFYPGSTTERGRMHDSGGFSWGDATDPGATNFRVVGTSRLVGAVNMDSTGGFFERSRATAVGNWTNIAFAAGNFTCTGGGTWTVDSADQLLYAYTEIGDSVIVVFTLNSTTTSACTTELRMAGLPVAAASKEYSGQAFVDPSLGGAWVVTGDATNCSTTCLRISREGLVNHTDQTNAKMLRGMIIYAR